MDIKNFFKSFNFKLELLSLTLFIIYSLLSSYKFLKKIELNIYFTDDRISNIGDFFSISIGIYVAVITILGTTMIAITEDILRKKIDKSLINFIMLGIIEALLSIIIGTYIDSSWWQYYYEILLCLNVMTVMTFCKFIYILTLLFKENLNSLAEEIDQEREEAEKEKDYKENIYEVLKKIEENTNKN